MSSYRSAHSTLPSWQQRNPSHSKTYLTKRNWTGQSLHATKSGRNPTDGSNTGPKSPPAHSTSTMSESDIHALPESSDDEDFENKEPLANVAPTDLTSASPKRKPADNAKPPRAKRSKLKDDPDVVDSKSNPGQKQEMGTGKSSQHAELDVLIMSSASQKRPMKTYKRVNRAEPTPRSKPTNFRAPRLPSEATADSQRPSKTLRVPETAPKPPELPKKMLKTYALPEPTLSSTPASSGATQGTSTSESAHDRDQLAEGPRSPPVVTPLSTKVQDLCDEGDYDSNVCPYCAKVVVRSRLSNPNVDLAELRYLPVRRQQDFCHEHSLADAELFYNTQGYPVMKWEDLKQRISAHVPVLKEILQRERPSHFLQLIDTRIADRKNRMQIRRFLEEQSKDIDSFPPSYYGAKGTQIMAEAIAAKLSHCLSGKDADATLKALGVGPYVAFVLVPECTTRLVMEDMVVPEGDARRIMRESSQAGMLIHPEDEIVTRDSEDEQDVCKK